MSEGARVLELSTKLLGSLTQLAEGDLDAVGIVRGEIERTQPRLVVELLSVKSVPAGVGVSYGHTFITPVSTALALAAIGYGDGIPRKAGNRAAVTVFTHSAHRVPIVGRVAMNALVVDVGGLDIHEGDRAVVFGDPDRGEQSLAQWAEHLGESPVAVLAGIAARATLREV